MGVAVQSDLGEAMPWVQVYRWGGGGRECCAYLKPQQIGRSWCCWIHWLGVAAAGSKKCAPPPPALALLPLGGTAAAAAHGRPANGGHTTVDAATTQPPANPPPSRCSISSLREQASSRAAPALVAVDFALCCTAGHCFPSPTIQPRVSGLLLLALLLLAPLLLALLLAPLLAPLLVPLPPRPPSQPLPPNTHMRSWAAA